MIVKTIDFWSNVSRNTCNLKICSCSFHLFSLDCAKTVKVLSYKTYLQLELLNVISLEKDSFDHCNRMITLTGDFI